MWGQKFKERETWISIWIQILCSQFWRLTVLLENDAGVKSRGQPSRSVICGRDKESVNKRLQGMKNLKICPGNRGTDQTASQPSHTSSLAVVKRLEGKTPASPNLFFNKFLKKFYLVALGLSCSTQDLHCAMRGPSLCPAGSRVQRLPVADCPRCL